MLNYRFWQQRLSTITAFKKVGFASGIKEAVEKTVRLSPSVYVVPNSETSRDNDSTASTGSKTVASVDIVIVAKDVSDVVGAASSDDIYTVSKLVFDKLNGWTPQDAWTPIHKRKAKRLGINNGSLIWVETYDCTYLE